MLLAGCGSDRGPSPAKVEADLLAHLNQEHHQLLGDEDYFKITTRDVISEDRISYHVVASYTFDKRGRREFAGRRDLPFQYLDRVLEDVRYYYVEQKQKMTLLYRYQGDGVWRLTRVAPGYR